MLRLRWNGPIPPEAPHPGKDIGTKAVEFGMQSGRDGLLPGVPQADTSLLFETEVTAYKDAKGRVRYRGQCVQGKPEEPFLYLSYRYKRSAGWIGRGKAHLLSLTEDFIDSLEEGAVLQSSMSFLGHRPAGHVQKWVRVT